MLLNILLATTLFSFCRGDESPEVQTKLGQVRGTTRISVEDRKYAAFEGVPYAQPPIGDLRFEDPKPVQAWKGVWDATTEYQCFQVTTPIVKLPRASEDCLYLNIYVPLDKLGSSEKLDVIVSIHGGAFMVGSGNTFTKPDLIMDRDVVFITINYRLGLFGFLSSGDGEISGNFGMKDQVEALKWVQNHIESFNGNPNSVTITGVSAGAASVHLHLFSPLSKGLFHRVISESGAVLNPWVIQESAAEKTKKLSHLVGCGEDSFKYIKRCLKKRPAHLLLSKVDYFFELEMIPYAPFAPVVDSVGENRFLPNHPITKYASKTVTDIPWLVCTTTDEGIFPGFWLLPRINELDDKWPEWAPYLLDYNYTVPRSQWGKIANQVKVKYLGNEKVSKENFMKFLQIFTDRLFVDGVEQAAKIQSKVNKSPTYYYIFNYENNDHNMFGIPGVEHGLSSIFLYGSADAKWSKTDKQLTKILLDMLMNFIRTGVPTIENVQWDPVSGNTLTYLNITSPSDIKQHTTESLSGRDFWKSLNLFENEHILLRKDEL